MQIFTELKNFFIKKKEGPPSPPTPVPIERDMRELLRENLKTIPIDLFNIDDPLAIMPVEDRKMLLKYFHELFEDKRLINRIKYLINRQAYLTMGSSTNGSFDQAGAMNVNGMAVIKDEIEKLSTMYVKEYTSPPPKVDKFGI